MESSGFREPAPAQSEMARLAEAPNQNEPHAAQDPEDSYGDDYGLELEQDPQFPGTCQQAHEAQMMELQI